MPVSPESGSMPALMPVYQRFDVHFARGQGAFLFDENETCYLDFVAGIAVDAFGHAHPRLVNALKAQAEKLWSASNLYFYRVTERLAERLVAATFADTVFFQNAGVEAWDCCVKVIRKYFSHSGQPQRYRVITFDGNFHGRSLSAIAASQTPKMVDGFGPPMDGFDKVAWGDLDAVAAAITPETAAICLEPVQGEGGLRVAPDDYLKGLRALCDQHGLLLFFDEIQCGMGRTGKLFAHEWSGVTPDVMCIAKALGGGFPIGACLATARAAAGMTAGTHGSTFGGNPLATAVGNAVMDLVLDPTFLPEVARKGDYFAGRLDDLIARYPNVFVGRRGRGLMQGLRCAAEGANKKIVMKLFADHLLTVGAEDNVIRFLPPLIVTEQQIDDAVGRVERAADAFAAEASI